MSVNNFRQKTEAGDYPHRMIRQAQVKTRSPSGQAIESFPNGESLWCRVEFTNSRREEDYGGKQTGKNATIYVRGQYTTLSALDRLYYVAWSETYVIDSIKRGVNELICDCYAIDSELEVPQ